MSEYTEIGMIGKPHGLKGELKLSIQEAFDDLIDDVEVIFLQKGAHITPYFVEQLRGGTAIIVKLEGINTPEEARSLSGQRVCLPSADLIHLPEPEVGFHALVAYQIHDINLGDLGKIEFIEEYPQQLMAEVLFDNRPVLIPLNTYFIQKIDHTARIVHMDLPEGLLTL
jgi:16S rRNA processing protein RimM